jgi:short-subunit dehydrogenase
MALPSITRSVCITGCSSGIGEATAHFFRERGWNVIPTARKESDIEALREAGFDPVNLDVTCESSVNLAAERVLAACSGNLGAVVNNAGYGQAGAMEDLSREAMLHQFMVNVVGMQDFCNRFVPTFRAAGAGRIVNISSVVGRMALPFLGVYSASKFAVEAMSDAQRIELRGSGVGLSIVEPGPIITQFRKACVASAEEQLKDTDRSVFGKFYTKELKRRKDSQKEVNFINRPPEDVAKKIYHALTSSRPKRRYCVTIPAYAGAFMRRFAPYALTDRMLYRQVEKNRSS